MEEKTVDQMVELVKDSYLESPDSACRNLTELLLQTLELRDLAKEAQDEAFWEKDKEKDIQVEEMKNLRLNDILFFKDAGFKKASLQFFEKTGAACVPESYVDSEGLENFLGYLLFFTNCKLREFRNASTQIATAFFTGLLKSLHSAVADHKKDSKPKVRLAVNIMVSMISRLYFEDFLRLRTDDIDPHIVTTVLEHLMSSYSEGLALAVDEGAFLATAKHSDRTVSELTVVKEGPFTRLTLGLILKGLRSSAVERVARFLTIVPRIIGEIASSENAVAKWEAKSKEIAEKNVTRLILELPYLVKVMVEQKDEVGASLLRFFLKAKTSELCNTLISSHEEKVIFFMIRVANPKSREAALEYIEHCVKTAMFRQDPTCKRAKIKKFAHILYIVQKYWHEEIPGNYGGKYFFEQHRTLDLLLPFIPVLLTWFDASVVASMFLEEEMRGDEEADHEHQKAYIGCILETMLQSIRLIEEDKMPSSKLTDELRGESLETIKASCISARTMIKESVKKNLALRHSDDSSSFQIHVKLIMTCYPDFDQHLQSTLLDLFNRASDHMLLREVAHCFRQIAFHQERNSAIAGGIFVEQVQRLCDDQSKVLAKLVDKWKAALQNEETNLLKVVLEKIEEDMLQPLSKLSILKMSLPFSIRMSNESLDAVVFLLDVTITDNLHDRRIVDHCLRLTHQHLVYLIKNMQSNKSLQEEVPKWRDSCLEYFIFFMDRRSNPRMTTADALEVRRLAFPFLVENLGTISNDKIIGKTNSYRRPDDQLFKIIWQFIEDYVFTSEEGMIQDPAEHIHQSPEGKREFGNLDVERSPIQDSDTKDANRIQAGKVFLRIRGFKFVEDAATVMNLAFKLSGHLFRTIGMNLAQCLILKILNLESPHQGVFLSKMDEFYLYLIKQEQEIGNTQRLVFWKFVHSCFSSYDFATLKKLSKVIFKFYARHHGSDEAKKRYENFCFHTLQWAVEQKDPESADRVIPFIKKSLFEEQRFLRMLYFVQNILDNMKEEYKGRDEEMLKSDKYRMTSKLRDMLAKQVQMQSKDEDRPGSRRQSRSAKRPSASKRKSKAGIYMDDEKENPQPVEAEEQASKKGPKRIKGKKTKTGKSTARDRKDDEDEPSKGKSSTSHQESAGRRSSRSAGRQSGKSDTRRQSRSQSSQKSASRNKSKGGKKAGQKDAAVKKQKSKVTHQEEEKPVAKKNKGKGKKK